MTIGQQQKDAILSRITKDELAQVTKELVDIPSPTGHEAAMGEYMLAWFRKNGLAAIRQDVAPGRVNAVGIVRGTGGGASLMINGHLDTSFTGTEEDRVLTRDQILRGNVPDDPWCRKVARGFHPERSADVEILLYPYWIGSEGDGTSHGSPYSYDSHIPLVIMGPGIRPGRYHEKVALNDLAPTLATLLSIETPSGSAGRVLREALAP